MALVAPDVWLSQYTQKPLAFQQYKTNIGIYTCLVTLALVLPVMRAYLFFEVSTRSSERFHDRMVKSVLKAPVLFFDTNPAGRILNRFSEDIGCLDELLPKTFHSAIQFVLLILSAVLISSVTNPWIILIVVPLLVLFIYCAKYYLKTSRELKRLESICRSPVFSHFSETINGLDTIRTRRMEKHFIDKLYR